MKPDLKDVLKHYGVKGMKWDESKRKIKDAATKAEDAIDDAGDEVFGNDSITDELKDVLNVLFGGKGNLGRESRQLGDAVKDKLEDVGKDVKKRGERILTRIFGKSTPIRTATSGTTIIKSPVINQKTINQTIKKARAEKAKNAVNSAGSKVSKKFEYSRERPKMRNR